MQEQITTFAAYSFIPIVILTAILLVEKDKPRHLFFLAVVAWIGIYGSSLAGRVQQWNVFHYWLNTRYIDELGYYDLYACALEADPSQQPSVVRDLYSYELTSSEHLRNQCPRPKFTDPRWESFKADLDWLKGTTGYSESYWNRILRDKGLNTTPAWVALVEPLATRAPAGSLLFWLFLYADFILLVATLAVTGYVFGLKKAAILAIAILTWIGTFQNLMGHWWQYEWMSLILLGHVASAKRRPFVSGGAFALATAFRLFPVVLYVWPLVKWRSTSRRFWYGSIGVGSAAFIAGASSSLGPSGWSIFLHKMTFHSRYLVAEPGNFGLRNVVFSLLNWNDATNNWNSFTQGLNMPIVLGSETWVWPAVIFVTCLSLVFAKQSRSLSFATALPLFTAVLVVNPYYYIIFGIYFLEESRARRVQAALLISLVFYIVHYAFPPIAGFTYAQIVLIAYMIWQMTRHTNWPIALGDNNKKANHAHWQRR